MVILIRLLLVSRVLPLQPKWGTLSWFFPSILYYVNSGEIISRSESLDNWIYGGHRHLLSMFGVWSRSGHWQARTRTVMHFHYGICSIMFCGDHNTWHRLLWQGMFCCSHGEATHYKSSSNVSLTQRILVASLRISGKNASDTYESCDQILSGTLVFVTKKQENLKRAAIVVIWWLQEPWSCLTVMRRVLLDYY